MNNNIDYKKCCVTKVGNKTVTMCDSEKTCKTVNGIMECQGYDKYNNDTMGRLNDMDNVDNVDNIEAFEENLNITGESPCPIDNIFADDSMSLIKSSISNRMEKMNYPIVSKEIREQLARMDKTLPDYPRSNEYINLIMNQQESPNTFNEQRMPVMAPQPTPATTHEHVHPHAHKYRFWVKLILILFALFLFVCVLFCCIMLFRGDDEVGNIKNMLMPKPEAVVTSEPVSDLL